MIARKTGTVSRQRVEAALALEVADRPPVGAWGHDYLAEWDASELARVHVRAQRRYGWDFVKFQLRATCFGEAFGSEFRPSEDAHAGPVLVKPALEKPADLAHLVAVPETVPPLQHQIDGVGMIAKEVGDDVPVIQTVFSPLSVADYLISGQRLAIAEAFREHPEAVLAALKPIAETLSGFVRRSIEAGAAGIFYAVTGAASAEILSREEYEEVLPFDLQVLQAIDERAWFNVGHLCGPKVHFDLSEKMPVQAVSWSVHDPGNPPLDRGVRLSGKAAMGGIDRNETLVSGTVEAVRAEARAAASSNGGKGVIVAPGCSVPTNTPARSLRALAEAVD